MTTRTQAVIDVGRPRCVRMGVRDPRSVGVAGQPRLVPLKQFVGTVAVKVGTATALQFIPHNTVLIFGRVGLLSIVGAAAGLAVVGRDRRPGLAALVIPLVVATLALGVSEIAFERDGLVLYRVSCCLPVSRPIIGWDRSGLEPGRWPRWCWRHASSPRPCRSGGASESPARRMSMCSRHNG